MRVRLEIHERREAPIRHAPRKERYPSGAAGRQAFRIP
jgi:hypothetical protein